MKPRNRYNPKYNRVAIDLGTEGKSKAEIAKWFNVTPNELDEWARTHPGFALAMIRALEASRTYWKYLKAA